MSANTTTAPATAQLTTANEERAEVRPCSCRFVTVDGKRAACQRTTKREFAPGHDAQLKSRLIKALVTGAQVGHVTTLGKDAPVTNTSAAEEAGRFGFGYQVAAGYARAQRLATEKADRKAARDAVREANRATREAAKELAATKRAEAKAAKEEQARREATPQVAKVGRWEYPGTVVADGSFAYVAKDGTAKVAAPGKYELVAE